eukprot:5366661-Prymnesium_polylepis.1
MAATRQGVSVAQPPAPPPGETFESAMPLLLWKPMAQPYTSLEEVDLAIKSDGLHLWVEDYPDTSQGFAHLKKKLQEPRHASKLARLAATTCELFGFSERVVKCAKSIEEEHVKTITERED